MGIEGVVGVRSGWGVQPGTGSSIQEGERREKREKVTALSEVWFSFKLRAIGFVCFVLFFFLS